MSDYSPADWELEYSAIRASGPGGQHVNKTSTAIELRFNIHASAMPAWQKTRLLKLRDRRITSEGVVVLKAQRYRSQDKNRQDALTRLQALLDKAANPPKKRIPTRPGRAANERRLKEKKQLGDKKAKRGPIDV